MKYLKSLLCFCTLHRKTFLFEDEYSKRKVYSYVDCFGDRWMKESRFGIFSLKLLPDDDIETLKEAYNLLTNYMRIE